MKHEERGREFFSKKFLIVLLAVSILTNIIVITNQKYPNILNKIQIAFIPAPEVLPADHMRGNPNAKITIIEYADFQCFYCSQFHEVIQSIVKETNVRWIYRHFPLTGHPLAGKAAEAAECAGDQGKFWEYVDALFSLKGKLSDKAFVQTARRLGLNALSLEKCVNSGKHTALVAGHYKDGVDRKINATPTFFINGKRFVGSVPMDELRKLIAALEIQ